MGDDEYHPMSQKGTNLTEAGGIGYTVVDSIDTMLLMGLEEDHQRAKKWIETKLDLNRDAKFNTFEVSRLYRSPVHSSTFVRLLSAFSVAFYPHIISRRTSFISTRRSSLETDCCLSSRHRQVFLGRKLTSRSDRDVRTTTCRSW